VFVTGGTGCVGSALVEKLLRSCPDLHQIFVLIRDKKGKDIKQRLDTLLNGEVT
jgi:fatty acyl-CoA reductase